MSKKLDKILEGVPKTTREEIEIGKFVHDSEQGKWRQIEGLEDEALLLGKFRGTTPPTISETGFYPLKINSSGKLEVSNSNLETRLDTLEASLTSIETKIDLIKTNSDKFKFDGDNLKGALF